MREIPREYICPITQDIMKEPVIANDGYTYEKAAITAWLGNPHNKSLSPINRQKLDVNNLVVNRALKDLIEAYNNQPVQPVQQTQTTNQNQANSSNVQNNVKITHIELLNNLTIGLEVDSKEVYQGSIVEQTMVAMSGVYASQKNAMFRRDNTTGNTNFTLSFASSAEHQKFLMHYRQNYASSILDGGVFIENKAKITFNTNILNDLIAPAIADYKKNSHQQVMEQLASKLNVPFTEVFTGSTVEQSLVKKAGITTSQKDASYRRQEDYTTRFNLSFVNYDEYKKFTWYYEQNYPNLIIRKGEYQAGGLTCVDVSTRILLAIVPQLAEVRQNAI